MSDATQTGLQVPEIDWSNYDTGGKLTAPPQAKSADGKYIVYYAQLPAAFPDEAFGSTQQGYLKVNLDPLTLINAGPGIDGYQIRFQSASAKKYTSRDGKEINASQLGNFLVASKVGLQPTDLDGYKAAVRASAGGMVPITIEWEVYDKATTSQVRNKYDEFEGPIGQKVPVITTADNRTLVARAKVKNFVTR